MDILELVVKGCLLQGDGDTLLLILYSAVASHPGRPHFEDPIYIYVPLLARPQIMHAYHADASCHLGVTRALKNAPTLLLMDWYGILHNMLGTPLPQTPSAQGLLSNRSLACPPYPLAQQP